MLTQPAPLQGEELRKAVEENLERMQTNAVPLWGIFYKGKQLNLSKARVYYQKGRAKTELLRHFRYSIFFNAQYRSGHDPLEVKKFVEDMIDNGIIEIKQL